MSHYAFMSHQTNDLNSPTPRPDDFIHIDYPDALPVSKRHQEIIHTIQEHPVVIICGTTGSGKTTQLPKMVYQAGFGRTKRIGITQPRRLAATGMAQRVKKPMPNSDKKSAFTFVFKIRPTSIPLSNS